jgi:hypothetical protein
VAKVLVYGWYGHANVGDELMADGLRVILPSLSLRFVSKLTKKDVDEADLLLVGGGSFLYAPLNMEPGVAQALPRLKVIYAGVGIEGDVHPDHTALMSRAEGVFARSNGAGIPNVRITPDLVYALGGRRVKGFNKAKSLLVLPNSETLPSRTSPTYVRPAWEYYKSEFCQAVDELVADGWTVTFAPFCDDARRRDSWPAAELIGHCDKRHVLKQLEYASWTKDGSYETIAQEYDRHAVVLTQRFHGAVIAQATSTPCVVVHHHDKLGKLDPASFSLVPYYGVRKDLLLNAVKSAKAPPPAVNASAFDDLRATIEKALG